MRKVAIVGFSGSSREDAPFGDPSFELWGMNNLHSVLPGKTWHRWFDMHRREYIGVNNGSLATDHVAWLRDAPFPIYMQQHFPEFPTSHEYPLADIQDTMRNAWGFPDSELNYFHSGFAYAIALALFEGVDEIHIYGIDMVKDSEWAYQRANCEGWITLARQQQALSDASRNVRVVVAERCALMKGLGLYGYADKDYSIPIKLERSLFEQVASMRKQKEEADREHRDAAAKMHTLNGYLQCAEYWLARMGDVKRGAEP